MTTTLAEPRSTTVACHQCRRDFAILCSTLRELVEAGVPPHCGCKAQRPLKKRDVARPAVSKCDLVLLAVQDAVGPGGYDAPLAEIVLAAWRASPVAFGLPGHRDAHPDSNRVIMEVVKMKGRGLLARPREKHYTLTAAGRKIAALLLPGRGAA